ncbi:MAG: alanyl-tRNA editing protein [Bryobacteraceae bacterium]
MTERLYYADAYLRAFQARVVETSPDGMVAYLDRTAFYPSSGGQPFDTGTIGGAAVVEATDEGERIAHRVAAPVANGPAACAIDWKRRFDHMQQHTGQHLLSAVFDEAFGLRTASFHLGAESSTIDLEGGAVEPAALREAERRANEAVCENRAVSVGFEDAREARGLRKAPERAGALRIVTIEGLDRSACGGTHVRATGEIGVILLRKLDRIRQTARVEFLCGGRAAARARADYDALAQCAQAFSAPLDETPALVAAQLEAARAAEKARRKLELDMAGYRGRELYGTTAPDADGVRRATRRAAKGSLDELRALAQSFTAQPMAVFLAALDEPPSVLLAVSADAGIDAGRALQAVLAEAGGRGGGNARIAQGSVPGRAALDRAMEKWGAATGRR